MNDPNGIEVIVCTPLLAGYLGRDTYNSGVGEEGGRTIMRRVLALNLQIGTNLYIVLLPLY